MILLIVGGIFIFLGIVLWGAALYNHQGGHPLAVLPGVLLLMLGGVLANAGHYKNKRGTITG